MQSFIWIRMYNVQRSNYNNKNAIDNIWGSYKNRNVYSFAISGELFL